MRISLFLSKMIGHKTSRYYTQTARYYTQTVHFYISSKFVLWIDMPEKLLTSDLVK